MRKPVKTYGYARLRQVPALDGTDARTCGKCSLWFAARSRERVCDDCVPQKTKVRRLALDPYRDTRTQVKLPGAAGQSGAKKQSAGPGYVTESDLLGVNFTRPIKICYGLALEAAACFDGKRPKNAWRSNPLAPRRPR